MELEYMGIFLGIFFGYLIWSLQSAVGYWIFGLLLGYEFISFSFWGMMVLKENGRLKFRFTNFSLGAACNMKAFKRTYKKTAAWEICVWAMGIVVMIPFWLTIKEPVEVEEFIKLGIPFGMACLYFFQLLLLIYHMIQMYGKGENSVLWREQQEALNRLDEGGRPRDLRLQYEKKIPITRADVNYMQFELLKYYSALDAKRYEKLKKYVQEFRYFIPERGWNTMYTPYYYEMLFYHCCITGDVEQAESIMTVIRDVVSADMDVNGRRVYACYLYYTGKDKKTALQAAKEGLQVADTFVCKGIAYMERELLQELIDKIEQDLVQENDYQ